MGICGSIAAYKCCDLLRLFLRSNLKVGVTLTKAASEFVTAATFAALGADPVCTDMFPAEEHPFLHLYPGQNADAFLIAPATASMLSKILTNLSDDMLSCQCLSFSGPLVIAPAMNTRMWENPATQQTVKELGKRHHILVLPETGNLACGQTGQGKLADMETLYLYTIRQLVPQDLAGKSILITLGPTREPWDPVRFISNPSSGRMGASLAVAAWLRGAAVHVVHGPHNCRLPSEIDQIPVSTAQEMLTACSGLWPSMDIGCFTAAVTDFRPSSLAKEKWKRSPDTEDFSIQVTQNPDILRTLSHAKNNSQIVIGFAAESNDLERHAQAKLKAKQCDLMVANSIVAPGTGFQSPNNQVLILDKHGRREQWPLLPKTEIAWRIWDWLSLL